LIAVEADRADKVGMAGKPFRPSSVVVPVVAAFALFIGAIIARNFWLSLGLGIAGAITLAFAVSLLLESRKSLLNDEKDNP
jgi:hypothetical protein